MNKPLLLCALLWIFAVGAVHAQKAPHIVFIMGDEEYRSEESLPMLARIMEKQLKAKISLCYSLNKEGYIDPNVTDHIDGLEALKTADLMVIFARWRNLPEQERRYILDYVESGKPVVGFRTSTHTFMYKNQPELAYLINEWPAKVFGQQWITHHGHFDDGMAALTSVRGLGKTHPILSGVEDFKAHSWLYHVDGGQWKLQGDVHPLMEGTSLKSGHAMKGETDKYPLVQPVAWTKTYTGKVGKTSRVFFTTLGHPYDFKEIAMRRLAIQGMYWALGLEKKIPSTGLNVDFIEAYAPNNSGFGAKFKAGQKPIKIGK